MDISEVQHVPSLIKGHKLVCFSTQNTDPYNLHLHTYFSRTWQPVQINNNLYDGKLFGVALMIKLIRVKQPRRCQPLIMFEKLNALQPLSFLNSNDSIRVSGIRLCLRPQTNAQTQSSLNTDLQMLRAKVKRCHLLC